ncbi:hypothetical protein PC39_13802 [Salinisphaera sp. PC39]|uniref:efflux RND transporter periplasmic adaptor subunit n=1 Tax=Salinisphaera sp. PC39 TaxID=1304156 RepID=UPI00334146F0
MNKRVTHPLLIALGAAAGAAAALWLGPDAGGDAEGEREPLYWVAPMDSSYRRDEPGKSPMGMDLVPVYAEDAEPESPGTVRISPDVINNLGVRTGRVERGDFSTDIRTVGYVRYDEDRLSHVHARVEGWIERLHVQAEGDPVTAGEPLYEIYSPTLVNAQEELLLAMGRRNERLVTAAEARLAALRVPEATVRALKKDRRVRQTVTVRAPQSGVVTDLAIREGMYVTPALTMLAIGALDEVWVIGEVFERDAALVAAGDPVTMTLDYLPGREWTGRIDYVYPEIDPETRTARVRMRVANPDRALKPDMLAEIEIAAGRREDVLTIPREALIRTGGKPRVVLALGDGRFKSIEVEAGRVGDERAVILAGLKAGERVVTSAQFLIDSESSKTSDFERLHHGDKAMEDTGGTHEGHATGDGGDDDNAHAGHGG